MGDNNPLSSMYLIFLIKWLSNDLVRIYTKTVKLTIINSKLLTLTDYLC